MGLGKIGTAFATGGISLIPGVSDFVSDPLGRKAIDGGLAAQARATAEANAMLEKMYNQQRSDAQPWEQSGRVALSAMANPDFQRDFTAADFQKDPGYEFRMAEGQKALERSAAARGSLQGGNTLKALSRYGQDFASNEYGNAYNRFNADKDRRFGRLSAIAGYGNNALGLMSNASQNYGNQYSSNVTGMGNAYAGGAMAKANANQQLLSGLVTAGTSFATAGKGASRPQAPSQPIQSAPAMNSYWDRNPYS